MSLSVNKLSQSSPEKVVGPRGIKPKSHQRLWSPGDPHPLVQPRSSQKPVAQTQINPRSKMSGTKSNLNTPRTKEASLPSQSNCNESGKGSGQSNAKASNSKAQQSNGSHSNSRKPKNIQNQEKSEKKNTYRSTKPSISEKDERDEIAFWLSQTTVSDQNDSTSLNDPSKASLSAFNAPNDSTKESRSVDESKDLSSGISVGSSNLSSVNSDVAVSQPSSKSVESDTPVHSGPAASVSIPPVPSVPSASGILPTVQLSSPLSGPTAYPPVSYGAMPTPLASPGMRPPTTGYPISPHSPVYPSQVYAGHPQNTQSQYMTYPPPVAHPMYNATYLPQVQMGYAPHGAPPPMGPGFAAGISPGSLNGAPNMPMTGYGHGQTGGLLSPVTQTFPVSPGHNGHILQMAVPVSSGPVSAAPAPLEMQTGIPTATPPPPGITSNGPVSQLAIPDSRNQPITQTPAQASRYAGAAFMNSPSPSSLPTPKFLKKNKE